MTIFTELLTVAKLITNYELDATGATALWPDTTHYHAEVPAGKRWFVIGGSVKRDGAETLNIYVQDPDDNILGQLITEAGSTNLVVYPESIYQIGAQWVLDEGYYVEAVFGGAMGVNAYASCVVLEVDV